jgi:hypothetical protein
MKKVIGMEVDESRIIHHCNYPCEGCQEESKTCAKLYVSKGSSATVCVRF